VRGINGSIKQTPTVRSLIELLPRQRRLYRYVSTCKYKSQRRPRLSCIDTKLT